MGTFPYGDLSSLTDEHCNVTTYEDGEAFASGLDVHMAVAGREKRPIFVVYVGNHLSRRGQSVHRVALW